MNLIEEFEKVAKFYICETISYFVKGPSAMRIAKAKGWCKFTKGQKRKRYDIWIIRYADGNTELYVHVSGMRPVKSLNPTIGDIVSAFDTVDAKKRKDICLMKDALPSLQVYEQLRLF